MSRREDLDELYELLDDLQQRVGGFRRLSDCTGKSGWPERGLYFFFENGEFREDRKASRVVRVGTHAITATSKTTLWNRLHTHEGTPILAAIIADRFFGSASGRHFGK